MCIENSKERTQSEYGSDVIIYPYKKAIAQLIVHDVMNMDEKEIDYESLR